MKVFLQKLSPSILYYASCGEIYIGGGSGYRSNDSSVYLVQNGVLVSLLTTVECGYVGSMYKNPVSDILYVTCANSDAISSVISILHGSISTLLNATQCEIPTGIYANNLGNLVVLCTSGIISVQNSVITTIANTSICEGAYSMYTNPVHYVACAASGGVVSITNGIVNNLIADTDCTSPTYIVQNEVSRGVCWMQSRNYILL